MLNLSAEEMRTTTRAVRKRLDLDRPVPLSLIKECLEIALQAPSGRNRPRCSFVVVVDAERRRKIAEVYRRFFDDFVSNPSQAHEWESPQQARFASSVVHLAEHLHEVPVHVIACVTGGRKSRTRGMTEIVPGSSLYPAVWSYMLAARLRGLGTCMTTGHLVHEKEAADILGIPYDEVAQGCLIPTAYTIGTEFKRAHRDPVENYLHIDEWSIH